MLLNVMKVHDKARDNEFDYIHVDSFLALDVGLTLHNFLKQLPLLWFGD